MDSTASFLRSVTVWLSITSDPCLLSFSQDVERALNNQRRHGSRGRVAPGTRIDLVEL